MIFLISEDPTWSVGDRIYFRPKKRWVMIRKKETNSNNITMVTIEVVIFIKIQKSIVPFELF